MPPNFRRDWPFDLQLQGPEERPINVIGPNTSLRIVLRPRTTAMLAANGPVRVPPLTVPMEDTRSRDPTRRRDPQPNRSSRRVRITADRPQLELRTGEARSMVALAESGAATRDQPVVPASRRQTALNARCDCHQRRGLFALTERRREFELAQNLPTSTSCPKARVQTAIPGCRARDGRLRTSTSGQLSPLFRMRWRFWRLSRCGIGETIRALVPRWPLF